MSGEKADAAKEQRDQTLHDDGEEIEVKKPDIKSLVSVIPPAGALRRKEKKIQEKRIRVRYGPVKEDQVKINKKLADELGIKDYAVLVVAGRRKFRLKVIIDDSITDNVAVANEELLREHGIADNSISTIRKAD